jgi:hypothetical protein
MILAQLSVVSPLRNSEGTFLFIRAHLRVKILRSYSLKIKLSHLF